MLYKLNRVFLKSVATVAVALTVSYAAHAQDESAKNVQFGKFGASPLLTVGGSGGGGLGAGAGAKIHFNAANNFRLSASVAQSFGGTGAVDDGRMVFLRDVSLNGQYLFYIKDVQLWGDKSTPMYLYPLAGVSFYKVTINKALSNTAETIETGKAMNIGGGFEQVVNNSISFFLETKYSFGKDMSRLSFALGASFYF